MTLPRSQPYALMFEMPSADTGDVPEWVHLLPAPVDGKIQTNDDRGPYFADDLEAIAARSMADGPIEFDENHATYVKDALSAPARGWITEMQVRESGIWGRVEWTDEGRALIQSRAYRRVSPVLALDAKDEKTIVGIFNASLVNRPNFRQLTALQKETEMGLQARLAKMLGLDDDATEDAIMSALEAKMNGGEAEAAAQSTLETVATSLGCSKDAKPADIIAAAQSAKPDSAVAALQSQIADLSAKLEIGEVAAKHKAAEDFVDDAIKAGHAGVKGKRDVFIEMHKENSERTEALVSGLPTVAGTLTGGTTPQAETTVSLNSEEAAVAKQLGLSAKQFVASRDVAEEEVS